MQTLTFRTTLLNTHTHTHPRLSAFFELFTLRIKAVCRAKAAQIIHSFFEQHYELSEEVVRERRLIWLSAADVYATICQNVEGSISVEL